MENAGVTRWAALCILTLASVVQALCQEDTPKYSDDFIRGGETAKAGDWPWQVRILSNVTDGSGYCGGALVAASWVLTAAHCVKGKRTLAIGYGSSELAKLKKMAAVELIVHPDYTRNPTKNDVALIRLTEPINDIETIGVADAKADALLNKTNAKVMVTGWGATFDNKLDPTILALYNQANPENLREVLSPENVKIPNELRQVEIDIIDHDKCKANYGLLENPNFAVSDTELCAGAPGTGRDSCYGDSGGPLFAAAPDGKGYVELGVVSWGYQCGHPVFPGIYARVSSFKSWIDATMNAK
ncbi:serine protease [Mesorhizobium sp.]|uniref:S1 family serine peptidase n=1 Tax=Mesorhizobium sp. TaxID=1871066 RepID=UPI0025D6CDDB|nr:serine protease [Mesorhizobium sp.]